MSAPVVTDAQPAFVQLGEGGRVVSGWSLPRPYLGGSPATGVEYAAAMVRYFRAAPDETGSALLSRILTAPEFVAPGNRGAREGFLAGIVATLVREAAPLPAPPAGRLAFVRYGMHGEIERAWDPDFVTLEVDGDFTFADGTRLGGHWARRYVARLQHDPVALSDRLLQRIVAEPEFRSERSRGLRIGFTCELARRLARVRLIDGPAAKVGNLGAGP